MTKDDSIALSVLIPNYNYARYIGETIQSVLDQGASDLEIVIADNASTDDSVGVIRSFSDPRIKLHVNPCNLGFSANLEKVASLATGRRMILLSSDDRMKPEAIAAYTRLEQALGDRAEKAVWGSAFTVIDANGNATGHAPPDPKLWRDAILDEELTAAVGLPVRTMAADAMLRRSLELLRVPLGFATTCYPKSLHDAVGGYTGGRLYNPDKWFFWKLMTVAETVHVIDAPLFEYRVHDAAQAAQQQASGALKHLTDEYVATFSLPQETLDRARLDRRDVARAFIEHDIALRGLVALAEGRRDAARRAVHFGQATYPDLARDNTKVWLLRALLGLGPAGSALARLVRARVAARWAEEQSRPSAR
jgi:glycosyltransferase involved in cell wall biosynthesis